MGAGLVPVLARSPRRINKIRSILARCRGCGTLIVMRLEWVGPIREFAEDVLKEHGTCPDCGRELTMPSILNDVRIDLLEEIP